MYYDALKLRNWAGNEEDIHSSFTLPKQGLCRVLGINILYHLHLFLK